MRENGLLNDYVDQIVVKLPVFKCGNNYSPSPTRSGSAHMIRNGLRYPAIRLNSIYKLPNTTQIYPFSTIHISQYSQDSIIESALPFSNKSKKNMKKKTR